MFAIAMFFSLIPEQFPEFFGDYECDGSYWNEALKRLEGCDGTGLSHDPQLHWGYRHRSFCIMGVALFIVQLFHLAHVTENHKK